MEISRTRRSAFTLLELIIYVGVFAVVGSLAVGLVFNATRIQNRESGAGEVSDQAQFVIERVKRVIRDSSAIEIEPNVQTSTLVLRMRDPAVDPTQFFASGTTIYFQEGSSASVALTTDRVSVDSLVFTRFSNAPGKDTVQIDLQVANVSASNPQLTFSRAFRTAISRVSAAVFDSSLLPGADNAYDVGLASPQRWRNARFSGSVVVDTKLTVATGTSLNALDVWGGAAFGSYAGANTAPTNGLIVSGNVGIGTTTPAIAKLETVGLVGNTAAVFGSDTTGVSLIASYPTLGFNTYYNSGWKTIASGFGGFIQLGQSDGSLTFFTNGTSTGAGAAQTMTERMRIDSAGNLGIGTSTPSGLLTLYGVTDSAQVEIRGSAPHLAFYDTNASAGVRTWALRPDGTAFGDFGIYQSTAKNGNAFTAGTARLLIDPNGNVGIGTTEPTSSLHIAGSVPRILLFGNDSAISANNPAWGVRAGGGGQFRIQNTADYSTYTNVFTITTSTNFGIGTGAPVAKLDVTGGYLRALDNGTNVPPASGNGVEMVSVSGVGYVQSYNRTGAVFQPLVLSGLTVDINGIAADTTDREALCIALGAVRVTRDNAGNNCDTSSKRFKHDIQDMKVNGLALVNAFKPSSFLRNSDTTGKDQWGFIAEDMASIDPHLALFEPETGLPYSISKYGIMAVLAKAVQELDARTNGIERSEKGDVILPSGNLGIGTANPAARLEVSASDSKMLRLRDADGSSGSADIFVARGDATSRTGTALCESSLGANDPNAVCLAHWSSALTESTCGVSLANGRALCTIVGD